MAKAISLPGRDDHILRTNSVEEKFAAGGANAVVSGLVNDGRPRVESDTVTVSFVSVLEAR
jgi:hypothetical protein